MMKRATRPVDVPKIRRNLKNRSRIADTMCYGYPGGFAYVKFVLIWLVCIALDLLIGFRFELLYPVWLSIRNCYDSFRLQGLITSFHYSAFSVIFVCATLASDLVFFVLLPVQILLFLASSYIWIQFTWQTGERGFGSAQLFLWIALISFEYNWRYRGDSPLYLLLESSIGSVFNFLTGGLLSNLLGLRDSSSSSVCERGLTSLPECQYSSKESSASTPGLLGGFGAALTTAFAHSATFGSVLCRPFAAHCIGYPVVTLGFGIKTYMSLWRVKRRQREVCKENDFYGRLLAEALPSVYEGAKMYPRSNGLLSGEQDTVAEYETELPLSNLAICAPNGTSPVAPLRKSSRNTGSWKQQNGWRANGLSSSKKGSQLDAGILSSRREQLSVNDEDDSASNSSAPATCRVTLWRLLWDLLCGILLLLTRSSSGEANSQLDDRISLSSNEVDSEEEMIEQDDNSQADDNLGRLVSSRSNTNKRMKGNASRSKGGRARGAKSQSHSDLCIAPGGPNISTPACNVNTVLQPNGTQNEKHICNLTSNTSTSYPGVSNGVCTAGSAATLGNNTLYVAELEALRDELRISRSQENELRGQLQQATNSEKQAKGELSQLKAKIEQTDSKLVNCTKAREQDRASMQLMEKRLIEAHTKVKELEKEVAMEKKNKEHSLRSTAHAVKNTECGEACKAKKAEFERELRVLRRELKSKEDSVNFYEERLKQIQEEKDNNDTQELQAKVTELEQKCLLLEQSLSSENRLKQDLFRVLTETRSQTESLQQQLLVKDNELKEARTRLSSDVGDRSKLIPINNTHPPISMLRAPPGLPPPMPNGSLQNPIPRKLPSSISNEHNMEILTAVLSNAANNAYRPYTFNGHSGDTIFDAAPNGNAPGTKTSPTSSISPPPISQGAGKVDAAESGRFSTGKFVAHGSTSASVRST